MINPRVDILLATHNGVAFLPDQIASLFAQSHNNFRIYIRDDASMDATPKLVQCLTSKYPDKVRWVGGSRNRQGPISEYSNLMENTKSNYIMLCDQDDVWLPDKIKISLERMAQLESIHGLQTPILIHTDMTVVDINLVRIHNSFVRYQYLNPQCDSINRLLVQNVVTGCTILMNRPLKEKIKRIPKDVRMHDWWIGLVASLFGVIDFIGIPTMLYRQHDKNTVGAKPLTFNTIKSRLQDIAQLKMDWRKSIQQAKLLLNHYGDEMDLKDRKVCQDFCSLSHEVWLNKWKCVIRHRFFKNGLLRNLAMPLII